LHRDDLPTIRRSTVLADTDIATDSGTAELSVRPAAPGTAPAVARSAPGTERRWLDTAADVPTAALSALGTAADTARAARPTPASVTAAAVADTAPAVVPGTASRAPVSLNPQHSLERATAAEARGTDPYTEPADESGTSRPAPAETFAAELARHRTERPRAIPVTYRPLVAAIVGNRPVQVSTGVASRRALAKVGKIAATTGDTIHLASPTPPPDVIAHELTHVAHPSPVARFFDDDDHSPEEQRAEQVAAIMRRAPILPRTAAATPSVMAAPGRPRVAPATNVVRRSPASATVQPTPTGSISAAALAEQITQGASGVQRVIGGHRRGRAQTVPDTSSVNAPSSIQVPAAPLETIDDRDDAPTATGPDLATQFEYILELLEERVLRELERRGGRFRGGF